MIIIIIDILRIANNTEDGIDSATINYKIET